MDLDFSRFRAVSLLALLLTGSLAFGQGIITGTMSGTVLDPQAAVIAGAHVRALQAGTNAEFKTQTDSKGYFQLRDLPVGTYTVHVEMDKFSTLKLEGVEVNSGRDTALGDRVLTIGQESQEITVEAGAPLIETQSSQVSTTFETKQIEFLPHTTGGFDNLALFVPGVANNGAANFSNTNGAAIANNGLRGRTNNFQIDGQANNDSSIGGPLVFVSNPDAIGELQIVSNNFGAEYGRNSGTVVNYVTKAGTNSFHGSGFDYNEGDWSFSRSNTQKNPALGICPDGTPVGSSTPYASKCRADTIPRYVENKWGGTFGGPIKRNRAWFFGSFQNDKQRSGTISSTTSLFPTNDANGIGALQSLFPNNPGLTGYANVLSPYAIKAGTVTPSGNIQTFGMCSTAACTNIVPVTFQGLARTIQTPFDDYQASGRGDVELTSKDRLFGRYVYEKQIDPVGSGTISSGAFVGVPATDHLVGADETHTFSERLLTQVRYSYGKLGVQFAGGPAYPNCTIQTYLNCPSNVSFNSNLGTFGGFGLATNLPQDRNVQNHQIQNNWTYTHGDHTIKFGGELDIQHSPNHFLPDFPGAFTFNDGAVISTACNAAWANCSKGTALTLSAWNNLALGTGDTVNLAQGPFNFNFAEKDVTGYGQDDWRIRQNLTLNLGLRWEWDQQAINLLHDITVQNVAQGIWTGPTNVTEIPALPQQLHQFEPNFGFAYTPKVAKKIFGDGNTVIRGGYRIAYDPSFYNIFLNVATAAPVVNLGSFSNQPLIANPIASAVDSAYFSQIPEGVNPGVRNQTRVSSDFHQPMVQQWSFGFERRILGRIGFESRYVGNHATSQFETVDGNPLITSIPSQYIPSGITACTTAGAAGLGRPDCNFSNVRVRNNGAFSRYNGWQNQLTVRDYHNLTATVGYTFSKTIDNTSEIFSATSGGISNPAPENPFDPTARETGLSAQNFPHIFNVTWVYSIPFLRDQQGIVGHILGGWQWAGDYEFQSGTPVGLFQNVANAACDTSWNNAFIGTDTCRPIISNASAPINTVGRFTSASTVVDNSTGLPTTAGAVHWLVNNSFADAAVCNGDPFACTVGRNTIVGMARNNMDLSMQKNFKLNERFTLQIRGDALNALNYQYRGAPGVNVNSKNFNGLSGTTLAPGTFMNNLLNSNSSPGASGTSVRAVILSGHIYF